MMIMHVAGIAIFSMRSTRSWFTSVPESSMDSMYLPRSTKPISSGAFWFASRFFGGSVRCRSRNESKLTVKFDESPVSTCTTPFFSIQPFRCDHLPLRAKIT